METEKKGQNKLVSALLVGLIAVVASYLLGMIRIPMPYNVRMVITGALVLGGSAAFYSNLIAKIRLNIVSLVIVVIIVGVVAGNIEPYAILHYGLRLSARFFIRFILYFIGAFIILLTGKKVNTTSNQVEKQAGNTGTLEIIAICIFVTLGILVEYLVITSGTVELTWIGGIFGFIAIYMGVRLPGTVLKRNFIKLGNFGGMTYEQIAAVVGPCNAETPTVMGNGDSVIIRQWIRTGYHISLIFKDNVCIGKNHEAQV